VRLPRVLLKRLALARAGLLALIGLCLSVTVAADSAKLQVLTTIKPLQLMVKAIAGETIEVDVLLAPQQSPHNYQLRPSDRLKLAEAAQIYWIGPSMETFLARSVLSLPADQVQTLGRNLSVEHDHHDSIETDPHLWLDYQQIIAMSAQIEQSLSVLMPEKKLEFANNRRDFLEKMQQIDTRAQNNFSTVAKRGFIMSHAAYTRFLQHYQLVDGIALSDAHGRVAGAKHLQVIEKYIAEKSPQCFLLDPSEQSTMQDNFAQRYQLSTVAADAMGISIAATKSGFVEFYQQLVSSVLSCLQTEAKK
jgi:zinc transport system substrate-binding protein